VEIPRKTAKIRYLVAPILGWYTEGFNTADQKEAKLLFEELS
jgi:hypothetical protein